MVQSAPASVIPASVRMPPPAGVLLHPASGNRHPVHPSTATSASGRIMRCESESIGTDLMAVDWLD